MKIIHVGTIPGEHISKACEAAAGLARETDSRVYFEFNGTRAIAAPGDLPEAIAARWQLARRQSSLIKRYVVMHKTSGFIVGIYAERFTRSGAANSFTGNVGGDFWIGDQVVASVDNPNVIVSVSSVSDISRPLELQGEVLTLDECNAIHEENKLLSAGQAPGNQIQPYVQS
jgi:hypothetical protein